MQREDGIMPIYVVGDQENIQQVAQHLGMSEFSLRLYNPWIHERTPRYIVFRGEQLYLRFGYLAASYLPLSPVRLAYVIEQEYPELADELRQWKHRTEQWQQKIG